MGYHAVKTAILLVKRLQIMTLWHCDCSYYVKKSNCRSIFLLFGYI